MKLTDSEITRRLAEGVMGWNTRGSQSWVDSTGYPRGMVATWSPLTNESHAAEVRERMIELGYEVSMIYGKSTTWTSMRQHPIDNTRYGDRGEMCRLTAECALLALGLAKEEEL